MGATGEMFLRMREEDFNELTPSIRGKFSYIEKVEVNEYENHKDDTYYLALYKVSRDAKKKLQTYLFDKRHKTVTK